MTDTVLVTGATGILGNALLTSGYFEDAVGVVHDAPSKHDSVATDLRDRFATRRILADIAPATVVHTAALTDVDRCQFVPDQAYATNVLATLHIAEWIRESSPETLLVYISSDQVYSGSGPHGEDKAAPANVYGMTKHAGELAARVAGNTAVLRTNFVGRSAGRPSYTDWILSAGSERLPIQVDPYATFSPLHIRDLVALIAEVVDARVTGVLNLGARTAIRKADFVRAVSALAGGDPVMVEEVGLDDSDRAPRALDLALSVGAAERVLGHPLPSIENCLDQVAHDYRPRELDAS